MREDLETTAEKLYDGKLEMVEAPGDPYAAQLAKSKASRVQSAEKVLEKAKKKIEKANKPAASGKGKRGRGAKKNKRMNLLQGFRLIQGFRMIPKKMETNSMMVGMAPQLPLLMRLVQLMLTPHGQRRRHV